MKIKQGPLKCWDIYSEHLLNQNKLFSFKSDIETLKSYQKKLGWDLNLSALITGDEYDALVLTDYNKQIVWANKGFAKMTGYPINYAIGKKPSFLQGRETCKMALERINKSLKKGISFKDVVLNYKKNGDIYKCELNIIPLENSKNDITHFLALEKELRLI